MGASREQEGAFVWEGCREHKWQYHQNPWYAHLGTRYLYLNAALPHPTPCLPFCPGCRKTHEPHSPLLGPPCAPALSLLAGAVYSEKEGRVLCMCLATPPLLVWPGLVPAFLPSACFLVLFLRSDFLFTPLFFLSSLFSSFCPHPALFLTFFSHTPPTRSVVAVFLFSYPGFASRSALFFI